MASSSSAAAPARWGILATIPRVCASDDDLPPGADFSLALATPPGISVLTLSPRISPDPLSRRNFPSVLVADPSGLLLLHATQGAADRRTAVVIGGNPQFLTWPGEFVHGYFVCDARLSTARRLPDPTDNNRILDAGNLGLLTRDGGRTYLVAELQPIVGSGMAMLLRYSSETAQWTAKVLSLPLKDVRPWAGHGVFSFGERLFWFDVSWGLLTCLPYEEEPVLEFVPLPPGWMLPFHHTSEDLQRVACFAVCDGAVRFFRIGAPQTPMVTVERLRRPVGHHAHGNEQWVTSYTLCSDEDTAGSWNWRIHHQVSFEEIWGHQTYEASGLPKKLPKLACVDPCCVDHVHFFLNKSIFCINLVSATVYKCSRFRLENPPRKYMCSRFVLASALSAVPSSLSADSISPQNGPCSDTTTPSMVSQPS